MQKSGVGPIKSEKELTNTNLGVINLSSDDISAIGWKEILEILSFIILIWTVCKWCCKKRKRNSDKAARKLEEMIQNNKPRAETSTAIPAVTFQPGQPGSRVVFMTQRENMPRFNKNNEGPQINEIPQETGQTDCDKYR